MRIAYLECFSGISGDMFLGALVEAGVSSTLLHNTVAALEVGARLEFSRVLRSGISASKADVWVNGEKDAPREESRLHQEHQHEHSHGHRDPCAHSEHDHSHGRGLTEIKQLISNAPISETAKKTATAIFETLGAAEAKIHNTSIERVHFHEVGASDAIVEDRKSVV